MTVECEKLLKFPATSLPALDISFTLERGSANCAGLYIRCLPSATALRRWPLHELAHAP